ncbi:Zn-ribbon domain-containing OB-fold protein [Candidatus Bathyarchaeota archaeon]|nr:Zn-ribbon domain-containing OB-fold protein [Candidatus Bathyarchaeota archaeon]
MSSASMPAIKSKPVTVSQDIPVSKTLRFWEGLKEGKIYATKCCQCGSLYFPPAADCANCLSTKVEWVELSSEAEIETFTHIVVRPTSFSQRKPYTVAIGKLKEGVKVLAWLTGFKLSQVKVGMKAKLVAKVSSDAELSYEFVPLDKSEG